MVSDLDNGAGRESRADRPVAHPPAGRLRGTRDGDCLSFRGIPYAEPPLGDLRFRAPRPARAWEGVREALDFGAAAPQIVTTDVTESGNNVVNEDCLTLNVWTPRLYGAPLPVMVWIHGGALIEGSSRNYWYNGAALALRGDVVVVTLQYRLGAFGFLYLGEAGGEEFADSGNLGLLDQVAALRWVRDNIAAFGGDAGNVTIFGESAGGASVAMLLGMPAADGLFHKAVVQSISPQLGRPAEQSAAVTREFMRAAGASTVQELQSLRAADLIAAQDALFRVTTADNMFWPTIDGHVLHAHALTRLHAAAARVPVLIGTTLDEVRFWTEIEDVPLLRKPHAALSEQLEDIALDRHAAVVAAYGLEGEEAEQGRVTLASDLVFRLPSIRLAEALQGRQPVWMYLFTYRSTSTLARYDSAHAMELPFLFGALEDPGAVAFTGRAPGRDTLSARMQDAWTAFARHGAPGPAADWPAYEPATRATMLLDTYSHLENDPFGAHRAAWEGVPFDGAAPDDLDVGRLLFSED